MIKLRTFFAISLLAVSLSTNCIWWLFKDSKKAEKDKLAKTIEETKAAFNASYDNVYKKDLILYNLCSKCSKNSADCDPEAITEARKNLNEKLDEVIAQAAQLKDLSKKLANSDNPPKATPSKDATKNASTATEVVKHTTA